MTHSAVICILAGFTGIMLGSILAMLLLPQKGVCWDWRLCTALALFYLAAMTWGMVELLSRLP